MRYINRRFTYFYLLRDRPDRA